MDQRRAAQLAELLETVKRQREKRMVGRPPVLPDSPWRPREIQLTPELERIVGVPRRDWEPLGEELARKLTALLKTSSGGEGLYPAQAYTLYELYRSERGAAGILRVGGGKSLIAFLAPYVTRSFRPLLIEPGSLVEKTRIHMERDRHSWEIPNFIRVESYEKLGHPNHTMLLYEYKPDLIILDEASKVKNTTAVVTKNIDYYIGDCRRGYLKVRQNGKIIKIPLDVKIKVLILSGTLTDRTIKDYWHIFRWILTDDDMPLPISYTELEQWSLCLDSKIGQMHRVKPGALLELCNEEEKEIAIDNPLKAARKAYRRRLLSTPGIVSTQTPFLGSSLRISSVECVPPKEIHDAFKVLRKKWKTPDGWWAQDAHIVAMHAKQLAMGFYSRWNPRPPDEYVEAQKNWSSECRRVITSNRKRIDSEGQLIKVIKKEGLYQDLLEALNAWEFWKKEFIPNVESVWIHDYAIRFAARWMEKKENKRGIVWTDYPAFGHRLSEETGVSYYGLESTDRNGRYIERHPHNTPMIASVKANYEGKNLQYGWSKNLLMCCIASGKTYEQLLGRSHRMHQTEDEVTAEIFMSCIEHSRAFWSAVEDAEFAEDMESARKLLYADVTVPPLEKMETRNGVLWKDAPITD